MRYILSVDYTATYGGDAYLREQRLLDLPSRGGDSGGPVFKNPNTAVGIVSGTSGSPTGDNDTIYSHIGHLGDELQASVVTAKPAGAQY